jgi:hypothetical protein
VRDLDDQTRRAQGIVRRNMAINPLKTAMAQNSYDFDIKVSVG